MRGNILWLPPDRGDSRFGPHPFVAAAARRSGFVAWLKRLAYPAFLGDLGAERWAGEFRTVILNPGSFSSKIQSAMVPGLPPKKTLDRINPQMFQKLRDKGFEVLVLHHAEAILTHDMPTAVAEIEGVLSKIRIPAEELIRGGGGEGQLTQRLRKALANVNWVKHNFEIQKIVDGVQKESTSHEIDHVKVFDGSTFALEIEWNNKDPFFDRDLENFKRLHAEGAISIGGIITRGKSLQDGLRNVVEQFAIKHGIDESEKLAPFYVATPRQKELYQIASRSKGSFAKGWASAFVADKFGEATTHWRKLEDRVKRGVGNPCPLLLIGIPLGVIEP